jgi:hypothetical protein
MDKCLDSGIITVPFPHLDSCAILVQKLFADVHDLAGRDTFLHAFGTRSTYHCDLVARLQMIRRYGHGIANRRQWCIYTRTWYGQRARNKYFLEPVMQTMSSE